MEDAAALVRHDAEVAHEAAALAQSLSLAQEWTPQILSLSLAALGDFDLPQPAVPSRNSAVLSVLPTLYWVHGLDQAGLLKAADTVAALWASGAITVPLPDRGAALQAFWKARRERLTAEEREHLLGMVFDPRDFDPAMRRLCLALVALADNAGQHDIREEVGLQQAASQLLDLCGTRLEGAPTVAASDLFTQTRAAVDLLKARALQTAFAVRDFYSLIELGDRTRAPGSARILAERAQAGAAVLRWLAVSAAQQFAIDPRDAVLQTLMAQAQRWLSSAVPAQLESTASPPGHELARYAVAG